MDVHVLSLRARKARFKGSDFHSEQAFFCAEEPWPNPACHPEAGVLCLQRDLGEPRDVRVLCAPISARLARFYISSVRPAHLPTLSASTVLRNNGCCKTWSSSV